MKGIFNMVNKIEMTQEKLVGPNGYSDHFMDLIDPECYGDTVTRELVEAIVKDFVSFVFSENQG
jgi:hypothetical protein